MKIQAYNQRINQGLPVSRGFTLLEVLVALTIAGFALGSLFAVIGGNKRLAWRSEEALVRSTQARNLINYSQLQDSRGEVFIDLENDDLLLSSGGEFERPIRKTRDTEFALRQFEVLDEFGEPIASGSYWVDLEFPE